MKVPQIKYLGTSYSMNIHVLQAGIFPGGGGAQDYGASDIWPIGKELRVCARVGKIIL